MLSFVELKNYIESHIADFDGLTFSARDRNSKRDYSAVYLVEKPETHDITSNALIIKWNEYNGGKTIRSFAVEIRIMSRDIASVIKIKDALVNLLDFWNRPCDIPKYKKLKLSNEGGIYCDEISKMYVDKLFFDCKIY